MTVPHALLLHGAAGGWDELVVLVLGIVLTFVVLKAAARRSKRAREDRQEDNS